MAPSGYRIPPIRQSYALHVFTIHVPEVEVGKGLLHICTAGLRISKTHTKKFANKPEELRQFQDHRWKALGKKNSDLPGIFSVIIV